MGKIITFTNQKGGVGKTTTCVNVAAYLAIAGKKVLLIDMDPQGNASSGLGAKKSKNSFSVYNLLCTDKSILDDGVLQETSVPNLSILPSNIDLAGAEIELAGIEKGREKILKQKIAPVKDMFDYIVLDCPPSLGLLTLNSLTASDSLIIPIQCEFYALEGLSQLINTVRIVKKFLNKDLEIEGVVLTMFDSRSKLSFQVEDEIRKFFGNVVYETKIPRNVKLAEAPSYGKPIVVYDKSCNGAIAYTKLTIEFIKRQAKNWGELCLKKNH